MEKPTIVKLTDTPSIRVATFEEAFGDHSELKGKGRARKAARQQARQTRKATKKTAKQAKKQQKIDARLTRKATRKVGRQDIKAQKAAVKQSRKTANTASRIERRAMRRPDELVNEELLDESAVAMSDTPEQQSYTEPETQYEETGDEGEGTAESDEDYAEPAYHDTDDEESAEDNDEEYAEEEEGYDDDGGDEEGEYSAEGSEDFNGGSQFQYDSAEGGAFEKESIDKEANVGEILNRIEANKVLIQRIIDRMNGIKKSMNQRLPDSQRRKLIEDMKRFKTSLDVRNNRASELQMQLEAFSNASGKRAAKVAAKQATKTAKVAAKVERKAVKQTAKAARKATPPPVAEEPGMTEVEQGLNADIEEGRIEVPADETSSANGLELYAMGDKNEEFVPEDRIVEIKYGADGIPSGIAKIVSPSLVLWGAGLYLAFLANKKYQIIKF